MKARGLVDSRHKLKLWREKRKCCALLHDVACRRFILVSDVMQIILAVVPSFSIVSSKYFWNWSGELCWRYRTPQIMLTLFWKCILIQRAWNASLEVFFNYCLFQVTVDVHANTSRWKRWWDEFKIIARYCCVEVTKSCIFNFSFCHPNNAKWKIKFIQEMSLKIHSQSRMAGKLRWNSFVSEPIWVRAWTKPATSTVDSCFVLFGTRQYGVKAIMNSQPKASCLSCSKFYLNTDSKTHPFTGELTKQSCGDPHGQNHV